MLKFITPHPETCFLPKISNPMPPKETCKVTRSLLIYNFKKMLLTGSALQNVTAHELKLVLTDLKS